MTWAYAPSNLGCTQQLGIFSEAWMYVHVYYWRNNLCVSTQFSHIYQNEVI